MGFVLKTIQFCTNKLYVYAVHLYYTIMPDIFHVKIFQKKNENFIFSLVLVGTFSDFGGGQMVIFGWSVGLEAGEEEYSYQK